MKTIKAIIKHSQIYTRLSRTKIGKIICNEILKRIYIRELLAEGSIRYKNEQPPKGDYIDFTKSVKKHLVSFEEYFYQFEFWARNEEERSEFCSQLSLKLLYNLYLQPEIENIFWNKVTFLKTFNQFVKRKWIEPSKINFDEFVNFVTKFDCIVKPQESSCGKGIYKHFAIEQGNLRAFYKDCCDNNILLEECVSNESKLLNYHPQSLNTVRIVTVKGKHQISILGAFVRFGTGNNCVDNGGTDGILALINHESGMVITDAFDKHGNSFSVHPDSHIPFKGLLIPMWNKMISVCKSAQELIPEAKVIGWDVVVTNNHEIEIIEGNHRPDAY